MITKESEDSDFYIFSNCYHNALVIIQKERLNVS
jgi:hypothetical protein